MTTTNEIKGVVKWYSKSSGYGFITSENKIDYYFNSEDLKGLDLEKSDEVLFTPVTSSKKFKAKHIKIYKKREIEEDSIICAQCKRHMHPELKTFEVSNKYIKFIKSVEKRYECPYCDHIIGQYEESNGNIHLIACLSISLISIILILLMYEKI